HNALCRSAARYSSETHFRHTSRGFRVLRTVSFAAPGREIGASGVPASPANAPATVQTIAPPPPPAKAPFGVEQARAHQEAWARSLSSDGEGTNWIGIKLTLIPAGEFSMGSAPAEIAVAHKLAEENNLTPETARTRLDEEGPQHRVTLTKPYWLSTTEITVG